MFKMIKKHFSKRFDPLSIKLDDDFSLLKYATLKG